MAWQIRPQGGPARAGTVGAVEKGVGAGQQLAAGRSAHRRGMEIGEADALAMELIEVRSLQGGIAVAGQVAVSLVVGQDENHVGLGPFHPEGGCGCGEEAVEERGE